MSIVVLRDINLEIELGCFSIEPSIKSSPNDIILPSFKEGQHTYSNQNTNLETNVL